MKSLPRNLGCRFFPFITLNVSCHSLLACRVSAEKSGGNLMGLPLYVICRFPLVAFNNFSLSLILVNLITVCLSMFLFGLVLPGTLCASWTWVAVSFPKLGKFSTIISSNIFSGSFSLSLLLWDPYNVNIGTFIAVLEVSQAVIPSHSFFSVLWQ